jgi:hypothetical protein
MRRTITLAVFALLVSSGAVFPQAHSAPRARVRFVAVHRFCPPRFFFPAPVLFPFVYQGPYSTASSFGQFVPTTPEYLYLGNDSPARPQLKFKDGTTYTVSDYWRVDDQLHFITVEEGGTKSVPHTVPFDSLDVQRTKDAAAAQGFRFVIRDEPIQQWLEHRAQHGPRRTGTSGKS